MVSSPIVKLNAECNDDEEEQKEEYSKARAIITEMLSKAIPKDTATEAAETRHNDPIKVTLLIMRKYQPESRKEKEALLQQISCPEVCWSDDKAFLL